MWQGWVREFLCDLDDGLDVAVQERPREVGVGDRVVCDLGEGPVCDEDPAQASCQWHAVGQRQTLPFR